ncbi:hypothetical protein ACFL6M_06420 [Candidatus Eisenbacteria bacterium]|uniref:SRCR domain-containing protein n=1 Tax=Eiseniibacteriota bacterium TaxID=2212470 RepID=A0ABV6YLK1_UNCEI
MHRITLVLCLTICLIPTASGTTHVVNPAGTGDYPTIQAAIDGAAPGDTIALTDGQFTGSGNRGLRYFGKAIMILSHSGDAQQCRIVCQNSSFGVAFDHGEGPGSILQGVMIRSGYATRGGGINCEGSSPTINNCIFWRCKADQRGSGLACDNASPTVTDCVFSCNLPHYSEAHLQII